MSFFSLTKKTPGKKIGLSKKGKDTYSLVFNIGSGSVTGALVRFSEEPGVDIIYSVKEKISLQTEASGRKQLSLMTTALSAVAAKIQAGGIKDVRVDKAFYLFSSPWSVSQCKTICLKEAKTFKITEAYLKKAIDDQEKQYKLDQEKIKTWSDISTLGKVIEKKIIQLKVNGYVVENAYDKLTKDLEVSLLLTVVPEEILQAAEEAVGKTFMVKNVWCHSLSLPIFSVIRDLFPQQEDFIHVDMSDGLTDISVVKDGIMASGASFPLGRNHFIKELAKNLNITEDMADSMLSLQATKANDELAALKLSVAMDKAAGEWVSNINTVFNQLKEKIYVPETLFLIATNDLSAFIATKLARQDFKIVMVDKKNIKSDDVMFKVGLLFLDKLYKI